MGSRLEDFGAVLNSLNSALIAKREYRLESELAYFTRVPCEKNPEKKQSRAKKAQDDLHVGDHHAWNQKTSASSRRGNERRKRRGGTSWYSRRRRGVFGTRFIRILAVFNLLIV
jgi:hypothetical protein